MEYILDGQKTSHRMFFVDNPRENYLNEVWPLKIGEGLICRKKNVYIPVRALVSILMCIGM